MPAAAFGQAAQGVGDNRKREGVALWTKPDADKSLAIIKGVGRHEPSQADLKYPKPFPDRPRVFHSSQFR